MTGSVTERMDETPKTLRAIFDEALERTDAAARAAFVAAACGTDLALRDRVFALLRAHESAGGFLRGPGDTPASSGASGPFDRTGERIGRYRLVQRIGEGGCGVVYLAEQEEPVRRRVALKVIKLGMDTRSVIARFEAERQALALMDHPNIARVLDGGTTEAGRPFFVMELVQGVPLTAYCDAHRLATRERLELFMKVCHALQHAHQKGIIHRDVKPSNILVTTHDGAPVPKVIDFGIAKAIEQKLTDKTLVTEFRMLLGTPAYMSPEQVDWRDRDVDTRSDVYSLGVLLYELLTGHTPFETRELLGVGLEAMRRTICETEPVRPSTRVRALADAELRAVAQHRQAPPPRLISLLCGDLDWIVMRALEKDPARRYQTANALAADIQRHLQDEPVTARPPSRLEALCRAVRRNKTVFAAGAAVALALVAGLGVSTVLWLQERRARQDAEQARRAETRQREQAAAKTEESRQRLVRLHVASGNRLVDDGDWFGALLWFVEALRLEEGDAAREAVHRRRIASVLRLSPKLDRLFVHGAFVDCAEFNAQETRIVSTGYDRRAQVWDLPTGRTVWLSPPHPHSLAGARFTPDARHVLIFAADRTMSVADAVTGTPARPPIQLTSLGFASVDFSSDRRWLSAAVAGGTEVFDAATLAPAGLRLAQDHRVRFVRFSPDGALLATVNAAPEVRFYAVTNWQEAFPPLVMPGPVLALEFSPDSRRVMSVFNRNQIRVWDVRSGKPASPLMEPASSHLLYSCHFSPDGRWLATASWDGSARVWDAATGQLVGAPLRHAAGVRLAKFSPDSRRVATASWDSTARLWDPATSRLVPPLLSHAGFVLAANFSADGARLLTAGQDETIRLWHWPTNRPTRLTLPHPALVTRAHYSPNGRRILTCGTDAHALLWDSATGQRVLTLAHRPEAAVLDGSFSPDGQRVATATSEGQVHLWDAETGRSLAILQHGGRVNSVEFSPNGERLVTASADGTARVWNARDGQALTAPLRHSNQVIHAVFSPDGQRVVSAGRDRTARVWDAAGGQPLGPPLVHTADVTSVAFSPDGRHLLTTCTDNSMLPRAGQLWDAATGQPVGPPLTHRDGLLFGAFSPDGGRILTCGEDNCALIWDAASGTRLTPALPHSAYVTRGAFSPDGRLVATCGNDHTARVWDAATGEPVTPRLDHDAPVSSVGWSPDGRELLTCAEDGSVSVWDVSPTSHPIALLQQEAELLAAHRLAAGIGRVPLTAAELRARWEALNGR